MWWSIVLLLVSVVQATNGQAPGDEDDACLENMHHENEVVLMSSLHYIYLTKSWGGLWTAINDDDDPDEFLFTSWVSAGPFCGRNLITCAVSPLQCPQENWLITQFINNTMRQVDIYMRVAYVMVRDTISCMMIPYTMPVYVLQTNKSNISFTGNISSIFITPPVATLTDTQTNGTSNGSVSLATLTLPIKANLSNTGFYIAFRDRGVCFVLYELTVFYPVCDPISLDMGASFLERGLPGVTSVGACFAKMAISLNPVEDRFNATCTLTSIPSRLNERQFTQLFTKWTINNSTLQQCICQPGYVFTNRTTTSQCREFDCASAAGKIRKQFRLLTNLDYNALRNSLLVKSVITNVERGIIDRKIGKEKMKYLIAKVIIPSLKLNSCKKYKGMLEAMENSNDSDIRNTAKRLV